MADLREQLQSALGAAYRIDRELGGGGMSRVFLATETGLDRQVVIKVLPQDLAQLLNPERFEREIQIAAQLQHPHIVPLLSAGQAGGIRYYVMPWIEGESLRARLTREHELPFPDAVRILRESADALACAHARGVVHRDIKPENILLSGGHAVVTDFGVAKALTDAAGGGSGLTSTGLAIGTPAYMAPEQAAADPNVDARADIYALGVIGYEIVAGTAPFHGGTAQALLTAHLTRSPDPLAERRPGVPEALAALITRCLAKRPADRPQTAAEIVRELEALTTPAGGTLPATRAAPAPRAPALGRVAAALVILAVAALGVRAWLSRTPASGREATLAVLPLTPGTPDTALTRLGRELALTLSATLDGIGDYRTVDPLSVLALVPESGKPPGADALLIVARKLGASRALTGSVVHAGDLVRLDLSLVSATDGQVVARASLTGPASDITALTDSASWALLRAGWKGSFTAPPSLGEVRTRSLDALRAYLEGEQLVVRGQWEAAESAYVRAMAADTSFLLAYVGYAHSRWWVLRRVDSAVVNRINRNLDRLPEREAFIEHAFRASGPFAGDSLLREATRRWPDWWPGWFWYGDRMIHGGGLSGISREEAIKAFRRAAELNPGLAPAHQHLFFAALPVDRDLARQAMLAFDSLAPDRIETRYNRVLLEATTGEPLSSATVDSAEALLKSYAPEFARFRPLDFSSSPALQLEVNRRLAKVDPSAKADAALADAALWAARGAWDSASASASRHARFAGDAAAAREEYGYAAVGAWLGVVPDTLAARLRARLEPSLGQLSNRHRTEVLWLDGIRAWARGDSAGLERARQALDDFLARSSYADSTYQVPQHSLAAFQLALSGATPQAGRQLADLEWALADTIPISWWMPTPWQTGVHRLVAARWLAAAGDTSQAVRLLRWADAWVIAVIPTRVNLAIGGLSILERADLEAATGKTDEAAADYRLFLRTFDQPVPALKPLRTRAEQGLAKLEGRKE